MTGGGLGGGGRGGAVIDGDGSGCAAKISATDFPVNRACSVNVVAGGVTATVGGLMTVVLWC